MSQTRHLAAFSRRLFNVSSRLRDNRAPRQARWLAGPRMPPRRAEPSPGRGSSSECGNGPLPGVGWRRRVSRDFSATFLPLWGDFQPISRLFPAQTGQEG
jgi:hypothetical protein